MNNFKCSMNKKKESLAKKNESGSLDSNLSKKEKYALLYLLLKSDGSNVMQSSLDDALAQEGITYRDLTDDSLVSIQDGTYAAASPEYKNDDDTVNVIVWDNAGEGETAYQEYTESIYGLIVDNKINIE